MPDWDDYQEKVAQFFRDLSFDAETNVTIQGVRTSHDVDVLVRSTHKGIKITWVIECKAWKTAVPKEKVLALRSIVDDTGADRGFVMAENGYQSGALEAARLANITLPLGSSRKDRMRSRQVLSSGASPKGHARRTDRLPPRPAIASVALCFNAAPRMHQPGGD